MDPINPNAKAAEATPAAVARPASPNMRQAQQAIHQGMAQASDFFNNAPDLAIKNTLSFLKKRGNESFGVIATSSKRCKHIAESLVTRLNVPSHGVHQLIAKINAGDYKELESLKLTGDISNRELAQVMDALENNSVQIKHLDLSGCDQLTRLPNNLPRSLITLNLSDCYRLASLPANLPEGLIELNVSECYEITNLPLLPDSIETLLLNGCDGITWLTQPLPVHLKRLEMIECSSFEAFPPHLPPELVELNLRNCTELGELPEPIPPTLRTLTIRGCESLTLLPEDLPEGLIINR